MSNTPPAPAPSPAPSPAPAPAPTEPPAYTPPASQADLDRIISDRLARDRARFADYDDLKKRAAKADELEAKSKTETEKAVDAAREEGRAEIRQQLALERARTALTNALVGRAPDTSALLGLDLTVFVKGDTANTDAIAAWVAEHSTETAKSPIPTTFGQGARPPIPPSKGANGLAEAQRRFGGTK